MFSTSKPLLVIYDFFTTFWSLPRWKAVEIDAVTTEIGQATEEESIKVLC